MSLADSLHDPLAVDHAPVALLQLLILSVRKSGLLDLPDLKFQEGGLLCPLGLILVGLLQLLFPFSVLLEGGADLLLCVQDISGRKGIQQLQLSLLVEEGLVLMLAVDVDQDACRLLEE